MIFTIRNMKNLFSRDRIFLLSKFLMVGFLAYFTLVLISYISASYLNASVLTSYMVGYLFAIPVHYLGNSKLTFGTMALSLKLLVKYLIGLLCFFVICLFLEFLFSQFEPGLLVRIFIVTAPSIIISFLINWFWVFSKER